MIHPTAKVSEQVNRSAPMNTILQLSTPTSTTYPQTRPPPPEKKLIACLLLIANVTQ